MANSKSAEKRNRQRIKREAQNRVWRAGARTAVKKARVAIENGEPDAIEAVRRAEKALDRAAIKGVIHPNNAGRRKSRLYQALNRSTAAVTAE